MRKSQHRLAKLIGQRMRQLRYERSWKQVDLEAHMDSLVSRAALSMYETGKALPSMLVLLRLAEAFEVHPAILILDPESNEREEVAYAALAFSAPVVKKLRKVLSSQA